MASSGFSPKNCDPIVQHKSAAAILQEGCLFSSKAKKWLCLVNYIFSFKIKWYLFLLPQEAGVEEMTGNRKSLKSIGSMKTKGLRHPSFALTIIR